MIHTKTLPSLLALTVRAERPDNGGSPDTSGTVHATANAPATGAPIAEYREVLGRLWLLNVVDDRASAGAQDSDVADARQLLAEQAGLHDALGAGLAARVGREAAREWARRMQRCPWCGLASVRHDADSAEEIALP
jgi:hypothetical protein